MRRIGLVLALCMVVWSCSAPAQTTSTPVEVPPPSRGSATVSTPAPTDASDWPALVVANEDGVSYVDSAGDVTRLTTGRAAFAVDDTRGGVLFQAERGRSGPAPADTTIWWIPQRDADPQAILVPTPGAGHDLTLYDAFRDERGRVQILYVRSDTPDGYWDWFGCTYEGECPDEPAWDPGVQEDLVDRVRLFDVDEMAVLELATVGVFESGFGRLSVGGGLVVGTTHSQVSSSCLFIDPASEDQPARVAIRSAPAECESSSGEPCQEGCLLSPSGALLGYTAAGEGVVVDTGSGERIGAALPGELLDIDGSDSVALIRVGGALWMRSLRDPAIAVEVSLSGDARFASAPVDLDGPVITPRRDSASGCDEGVW